MGPRLGIRGSASTTVVAWSTRRAPEIWALGGRAALVWPIRRGCSVTAVYEGASPKSRGLRRSKPRLGTRAGSLDRGYAWPCSNGRRSVEELGTIRHRSGSGALGERRVGRSSGDSTGDEAARSRLRCSCGAAAGAPPRQRPCPARSNRLHRGIGEPPARPERMVAGLATLAVGRWRGVDTAAAQARRQIVGFGEGLTVLARRPRGRRMRRNLSVVGAR